MGVICSKPEDVFVLHQGLIQDVDGSQSSQRASALAATSLPLVHSPGQQGDGSQGQRSRGNLQTMSLPAAGNDSNMLVDGAPLPSRGVRASNSATLLRPAKAKEDPVDGASPSPHKPKDGRVQSKSSDGKSAHAIGGAIASSTSNTAPEAEVAHRQNRGSPSTDTAGTASAKSPKKTKAKAGKLEAVKAGSQSQTAVKGAVTNKRASTGAASPSSTSSRAASSTGAGAPSPTKRTAARGKSSLQGLSGSVAEPPTPALERCPSPDLKQAGPSQSEVVLEVAWPASPAQAGATVLHKTGQSGKCSHAHPDLPPPESLRCSREYLPSSQQLDSQYQPSSSPPAPGTPGGAGACVPAPPAGARTSPQTSLRAARGAQGATDRKSPAAMDQPAAAAPSGDISGKGRGKALADGVTAGSTAGTTAGAVSTAQASSPSAGAGTAQPGAKRVAKRPVPGKGTPLTAAALAAAAAAAGGPPPAGRGRGRGSSRPKGIPKNPYSQFSMDINPISRLSYSSSVSGDVLGLPANRYPAPRPSKQPQPERSTADGAESVATASNLGVNGRDGSYHSSAAPSEIGDALDLQELNASLPPSNFGTRQGTRQASRVMDSRDVGRHAHLLFQGVDPQIAAEAMQQLLAAEPSQTSLCSEASSVLAASGAQAAIMIALNSSRVDSKGLRHMTGRTPRGSSSRPHAADRRSRENISGGGWGAPAAASSGAAAASCSMNTGLIMQLPESQGYALPCHNEVDEEGHDDTTSGRASRTRSSVRSMALEQGQISAQASQLPSEHSGLTGILSKQCTSTCETKVISKQGTGTCESAAISKQGTGTCESAPISKQGTGTCDTGPIHQQGTAAGDIGVPNTQGCSVCEGMASSCRTSDAGLKAPSRSPSVPGNCDVSAQQSGAAVEGCQGKQPGREEKQGLSKTGVKQAAKSSPRADDSKPTGADVDAQKRHGGEHSAPSAGHSTAGVNTALADNTTVPAAISSQTSPRDPGPAASHSNRTSPRDPGPATSHSNRTSPRDPGPATSHSNRTSPRDHSHAASHSNRTSPRDTTLATPHSSRTSPRDPDPAASTAADPTSTSGTAVPEGRALSRVLSKRTTPRGSVQFPGMPPLPEGEVAAVRESPSVRFAIPPLVTDGTVTVFNEKTSPTGRSTGASGAALLVPKVSSSGWQPSEYVIPEEHSLPANPSGKMSAAFLAGHASKGLSRMHPGVTSNLALPPGGETGDLGSPPQMAAARRRMSMPMVLPPAPSQGFYLGRSQHYLGRSQVSIGPSASMVRGSGISARSSVVGARRSSVHSGMYTYMRSMSMRSDATDSTDARFMSVLNRLARTASESGAGGGCRNMYLDPYATNSTQLSEDIRGAVTPEALERISLLLPPSRLTTPRDVPATPNFEAIAHSPANLSLNATHRGLGSGPTGTVSHVLHGSGALHSSGAAQLLSIPPNTPLVRTQVLKMVQADRAPDSTPAAGSETNTDVGGKYLTSQHCGDDSTAPLADVITARRSVDARALHRHVSITLQHLAEQQAEAAAAALESENSLSQTDRAPAGLEPSASVTLDPTQGNASAFAQTETPQKIGAMAKTKRSPREKVRRPLDMDSAATHQIDSASTASDGVQTAVAAVSEQPSVAAAQGAGPAAPRRTKQTLKASSGAPTEPAPALQAPAAEAAAEAPSPASHHSASDSAAPEPVAATASSPPRRKQKAAATASPAAGASSTAIAAAAGPSSSHQSDSNPTKQGKSQQASSSKRGDNAAGVAVDGRAAASGSTDSTAYILATQSQGGTSVGPAADSARDVHMVHDQVELVPAF